MRGLAENVPWKRFWIPRETAPVLDGDGYLVDPEDGYGKVVNAQAKTLEQLEEMPCVALLGEPGIGKSRVVEAYCESVRAGVDVDVDEFLAVDFRWHHDLKQKIFATSAFTRWRDEGAPLMLLLDSLDEHPEGANEVARQLIGELHGGRVDRLRLRVACRTAEWPGVLDEQLLRLWKKEEDPPRVAFYALAPLRRVDVALAASSALQKFGQGWPNFWPRCAGGCAGAKLACFVGAMPQTPRPLRGRPSSARGPWKHDQTSGGQN